MAEVEISIAGDVERAEVEAVLKMPGFLGIAGNALIGRRWTASFASSVAADMAIFSVHGTVSRTGFKIEARKATTDADEATGLDFDFSAPTTTTSSSSSSAPPTHAHARAAIQALLHGDRQPAATVPSAAAPSAAASSSAAAAAAGRDLLSSATASLFAGPPSMPRSAAALSSTSAAATPTAAAAAAAAAEDASAASRKRARSPEATAAEAKKPEWMLHIPPPPRGFVSPKTHLPARMSLKSLRELNEGYSLAHVRPAGSRAGFDLGRTIKVDPAGAVYNPVLRPEGTDSTPSALETCVGLSWDAAAGKPGLPAVKRAVSKKAPLLKCAVRVQSGRAVLSFKTQGHAEAARAALDEHLAAGSGPAVTVTGFSEGGAAAFLRA